MSRKSTWMLEEASGETQPPAFSTTVQSIVVPGGAASKTIWREPWPAVMTPPPESVHVQVEPTWLGTLADAPDAPTGTEMGDVMMGSEGVAFTVTIVEALLVDAQPLAAVTVRLYVVVEVGEAVGVQLEASSSPVVGVQEQPTPPEPSS